MQAQEDKKMRSYAVIPPIMFDNRQRRLVFQNENGSKVDLETELSAYKTVNLWTTGEKETFRDKYIQNAKNFGLIANSLERKSAQVMKNKQNSTCHEILIYFSCILL